MAFFPSSTVFIARRPLTRWHPLSSTGNDDARLGQIRIGGDRLPFRLRAVVEDAVDDDFQPGSARGTGVAGVGELLRLAGISPAEQAIVTLLRQGSPLIAAILIPSTVLLAPVGEELCFRYAIFRVLESHSGFWAAAVMTALLFAAAHINLQVFPSLFLLGLWLSWLYRRTGSLLAPMLAHALFNAVSMSLILLTMN